MQTCPGFFSKSLLESPGNLLEICSVKFVDTLQWSRFMAPVSGVYVMDIMFVLISGSFPHTTSKWVSLLCENIGMFHQPWWAQLKAEGRVYKPHVGWMVVRTLYIRLEICAVTHSCCLMGPKELESLHYFGMGLIQHFILPQKPKMRASLRHSPRTLAQTASIQHLHHHAFSTQWISPLNIFCNSSPMLLHQYTKLLWLGWLAWLAVIRC